MERGSVRDAFATQSYQQETDPIGQNVSYPFAVDQGNPLALTAS